MDKILDGKLVSSKIKEELINDIKNIDDTLTLAVLQVGNNEASNIYVSKKINLCKEIGINSLLIKYDEDVAEDVLINKIQELNNDDKITGILLQLPLPENLDVKKIVNTISPLKDVDGLTSINIGKLYNNEKGIIPCTALGITKLLDYYHIDVLGKNITIIGRSTLVGIPLFKLMLDKNATVTICHSKTKMLDNFTKNSDIVVVAVGKKDFLNKEMIKEDAIIIDVGISRVLGKVYGDVNFDDVYEKCKYITKTPGGVGPLTVICLMLNCLNCYKLQKSFKKC